MKERPGERVLAGEDRLFVGNDAVHPEDLQLVLVLRVVGIPEVALRAALAGDALDKDVVVRRSRVIRAGGALLADHFVGEEVERARVHVRGEEGQLFVGEGGADLVPVVDRRARLVDLLQLFDAELVNKVVGRVDHDGEAVPAHQHLDELNAVGGTDLTLGALDGARGVGDVGLAGAEALEAAAGAGDAHLHADLRRHAAELFGHGIGDGEDGARTVDVNVAGEAAEVFLRHHGVCRRGRWVLAAATGSDHQRDGGQERGEHRRLATQQRKSREAAFLHSVPPFGALRLLSQLARSWSARRVNPPLTDG